jgi:hypothetical protein
LEKRPAAVFRTSPSLPAAKGVTFAAYAGTRKAGRFSDGAFVTGGQRIMQKAVAFAACAVNNAVPGHNTAMMLS